MAVTTTNRLGLTRWSAGTDPFTRAQMDASMAALEANAAMFAEGTLAARPAAGKAGRLYRVTDAAATAASVFWDSGTTWTEVRPDLSSYATSASVTSGLAGKANTAHTHAAADVTSGQFVTARLGSGTASTGTWLRGDGAWTALPVDSLAALSDTTITSPSTGQALRWNGTRWVNAFLATSDVNGLDTALAGKAAAAHTHAIADLPVATSGTSNTTQLVRADDARLSNARTPVAHTHVKADITDFAHSHAIGDLPVAASGTSSSTALVRADDTRLSNARTPVTHSHAIADLPVAGSGAVSSTALVRADDLRLSDARTPVAHNHDASAITSGILANGVMPTRLRELATDVADANTATTFGAYRLLNTSTNSPAAGQYFNLLVFPWGDATYAAQLASEVNNKTLYYRQQTSTNWGAWQPIVLGNDSRLTDARTPTTHTHPTTQITGLGGAATLNVGTAAGTVAAGNDSRFTDARTPVAHTHVKSQITDFAHTHVPSEVGLGSVPNVDTTTGGAREKVLTFGGNSGTIGCDLAQASVFNITPTGAITLSFTNIPASGTSVTATVIVNQPATAYTVAMPGGTLRWLAPTPVQTANKATVYTFLTTNAGATWYVSAVVQS